MLSNSKQTPSPRSSKKEKYKDLVISLQSIYREVQFADVIF